MRRNRVKGLRGKLVFFSLAVSMLMGIGLTSTPVWAADMLKVGVLEEPRTLNVWRASSRWSWKVLGLIYQSLYVRDPATLDLIPWLAATEPEFDAKKLSYTIKLRPAKWSDGTPFTSEDVAFTVRVINEFKVPRYRSKWDFVDKIETPDPQTITFYLKEPKAIFVPRSLTIPIAQMKQWGPIVEEARKTEKPLSTLQNHKVKEPIGCGPFMLEEWRSGAYVYLKKNEHFFGAGKEINGRALGPYIDGLLLKVFGTSDAAILAMKKGSIDFFWWGVQSGYMEDLRQNPDIELFNNERSALYYMGFNVRKAPFSDPNLRRAAATLIDEEFIISRILQGYGIRMHSIVPPGNTYWYCPDVPRYGTGLDREGRIKKAYEILKDAGYSWEVPPVDESGKVVPGEGIKLPDGKPMEKVTILTPPADYDPHRAMCGMMMQEWLRMLGIQASAKPTSFGALLEQVKVKHDFDTFILGYGKLSLDPDYLRTFFLSTNDKRRGWNMSGYNNPEFDRIANESAETMVRRDRRKLIWEMQKIIMRDVPYIPLYNPKLVEAVRPGKFKGWVQMLGGVGNIWTFCELKPK
ncbi:MAG: ABC transporter substrate-binding protein [Deltaproteobacteria bacterium]|nr:ABC transporter substrate-binding protein [Deltaproteobacteria bacterium]